MAVPGDFADPPREFSVMPFWFWNDALNEDEIVRQIADFEAHGVYGFIVHPRVGLPRDIVWMSDRMLHFVRVAVEEAERRRMSVVLYDEGMYPSGSSCGQVVEADPAFRCRCLAKIDLADGEAPDLPADQNLVAVVDRIGGERIAVVDRPVDAYIRGLHYVGDGPEEDQPPAADILDPDAVATFVRLVYDRYDEALGDHFGETIRAIFTDEPGLLGKCREKDVLPGTTGILEEASAALGYDFKPHLPALWYDDEPDADRYRRDYRRAVVQRLEVTYYGQLHAWCEQHGLALTGHPAGGDEIGFQRYFHIPGQDLVWRWVLPGEPSALEGRESTQAKCSASAMLHLGRRRNSNECFGAYGHGFTWDEMLWLVNWCFVRGVNLLYPHAFYYSIRGCRRDERPPDVGPNSPWWDRYRPFADACRRLSWLNTDCRHVCRVAILGEADSLPWRAARILYEHQRDFNYLEVRHLGEDAEVSEEGIALAGMQYEVLVVDGPVEIPEGAAPAVRTLCRAGRVVRWAGEACDPTLKGAVAVHSPEELTMAIGQRVEPDVRIVPSHPDLRARHVMKAGAHYYVLFNEGIQELRTTLQVSQEGRRRWIDPFDLEEAEAQDPLDLVLPPYALRILYVTDD